MQRQRFWKRRALVQQYIVGRFLILLPRLRNLVQLFHSIFILVLLQTRRYVLSKGAKELWKNNYLNQHSTEPLT